MKRLVLLSLVFSLLLLGCVSQQQATASPSPVANISPTFTPTISVTVKGDVLNNAQNLDNGQKVENGDSVAVDYLGTLDNGTVFDTSIKAEAEKAGLPPRPSYSPLEFKVGAGQMIAGFDKAVVGMKLGEEKTVRLKPGEAYGEKRQDLIVQIPRENAPENVEKGTTLSASNGMRGTVLEVTNSSVTIDFNHELAGKALNFKIIVRKITKAG